MWRLQKQLLAAVLMVEGLAAALLVVDVVFDELDRVALVRLAYVTAAAVLHTEISYRIELTRRRAGMPGYVDLTSVWTFAAAIVLPLSLATVSVLLIYLHFYFRVLRPAKKPAYRQVFNAATVVLAVHAAGVALGHVAPSEPIAAIPSGIGEIALALAVYTAVNTSLVVGVVTVTTPDTTFLRTLVNRREGVALEIATLCFGGLVATFFQEGREVMMVLLVPPLLLLHQSMLSRQLIRDAQTDGKTGCFNSAAWHLEATATVERVRRRSCVALLLMIDLDRFKTINDTHGHLVGDEVLEAVGEVLRGQARGSDIVGRFGGEEFVVLVPCMPPVPTRARLEAIADRVRAAIGEVIVEVDTADGPLTLAVTASVGGAVFPDDGGSLRVLLSRADTALYAAKRAGRNQVRMVDSGSGRRRDDRGPDATRS